VLISFTDFLLGGSALTVMKAVSVMTVDSSGFVNGPKTLIAISLLFSHAMKNFQSDIYEVSFDDYH
jgi:hypothetical protein